MAQTATQKRKPASRRTAPPKRSTNGGAGRAAKAVGKTKAVGKKVPGKAREAAETVTPSAPPGASRLARAAAGKALKAMSHGALRAGAAAVRTAADRAARTGKNAVETSLSRRLPIQVSIDVAVPLNVAWDEWATFESVTEGVHRIEDVERDDDQLYGRTAGRLSQEWQAEITDEREYESFAWRSVKGSDCAGLVTFHRLSDRLTRIELDLDVLPTNPAEAFALALHVAHHRAETELRRFKARVEFINPDVYEASLNGGEPKGNDPASDEPASENAPASGEPTSEDAEYDAAE
ncbi:MAG: hypothetical protein M3018_10895 [Actinomycetota bacterium]|nr:hypothetical protein [Actinomycetota bacterium]